MGFCNHLQQAADSEGIRFRAGQHQCYTLDGTPADCVRDGYQINGPMFTISHVGPVQTQNPNEFVTGACFAVEYSGLARERFCALADER